MARVSAELVWQEPPNPVSRWHPNRTGWTAHLAPLMVQPGRWARVAVFDKHSDCSGYIAAIRRGKSRYAIPPGRWEAVGRKIYEGDDQGKVGLFVRYLGPKEEQP